MRSKVVTLQEALEPFKDGQTVLFGDWHGQFSAEEIITGILEKGVKDLTAVACTAGTPDQGVGRLINANRVKALKTTHIAFNPVARDQMFAGDLDIEFIPQGTITERIRCGGFGLGGCLTPTGIGTEVEEGKQKLTINGKEYLLEMPIRGDITLIKASTADKAGNVSFNLVSGTISDYMAFASDTVIVEVEELVEVGELSPQEIDVPAPIVDMVYVKIGPVGEFCNVWKRAKEKTEGGAK